jgi:multicomponent Na+:H+ antiporter subunit E
MTNQRLGVDKGKSRGAWAAIGRWLWLLAFWLLLADPRAQGQGAGSTQMGPGLGSELGPELAADLAVGALAAALAAWASLRLMPPGRSRWRWGAVARLGGRFLVQSVLGGIDLARRALDPRLPLDPGRLAYGTRLPGGPARAAFGVLTGQVPGTLPLGTDAQDRLIYHCLDVTRPVAQGLAADEALLARALGLDGADGRSQGPTP